MPVLVTHSQTPYQCYCDFADARSPADKNALLLVPFSFPQAWLNEEPIDLVAVYFFSKTSLQYSVINNTADAIAYWEADFSDLETALFDWLAEHQSPLFRLQQPLPFQTVSISKPWGQEVWYTGVEERGVACFGSGDSCVPIPFLLAVMPSVLGETNSRSLILLKILAPLPEEVFGDLYFELHEEKQEVYIVTHVDTGAWPDAVGRMRLGFSPKAIEQAGSDAEFRKQFLQRVQAYRKVRKEIDNLLDNKRKQNGLTLNEELPVEQLKSWLQEIPSTLTAKEIELRQAMESYFGSLPLEVGDVVKVPLKVPHSLQHGVRTIEFQTPVYERQILAFCQKVLTQSDWDTERSVALMEVVPPLPQQLPLLQQEEGLSVEQVVEFSDFQVQRIALTSPATYHCQSASYRLLVVIQGALVTGGQRIEKEEAVLLPASSTGFRIKPIGKDSVVFLIASLNTD